MLNPSRRISLLTEAISLTATTAETAAAPEGSDEFIASIQKALDDLVTGAQPQTATTAETAAAAPEGRDSVIETLQKAVHDIETGKYSKAE